MRAVRKPSSSSNASLCTWWKIKMGTREEREERGRGVREGGGKRAQGGGGGGRRKERGKAEKERRRKNGEREKVRWFSLAFQSTSLFSALSEDLKFFALELHLSTILRASKKNHCPIITACALTPMEGEQGRPGEGCSG